MEYTAEFLEVGHKQLSASFGSAAPLRVRKGKEWGEEKKKVTAVEELVYTTVGNNHGKGTAPEERLKPSQCLLTRAEHKLRDSYVE